MDWVLYVKKGNRLVVKIPIRDILNGLVVLAAIPLSIYCGWAGVAAILEFMK